MRYDSPDFSRCAEIPHIPRGDPSAISKLLFLGSKYAMVGACVKLFLICPKALWWVWFQMKATLFFMRSLNGAVIMAYSGTYSRHVFAKPKKLRTSLAFFGALTLTKLSILAGSGLVPFEVKNKP
jgi:hypothetical protein